MTDLDVARGAARLGAATIRAVHTQTISYKSEVDPVTNADTEAQRRIVSFLNSQRPDDEILAEEHPEGEGTSGRWWLVDPLDGTVNYIHGIPHVSVSIALCEDGAPLVGVVTDVFHDEEFSAAAGAGAWLNGSEIGVSRTELSEAVVGTGFPYDRRERGGELGAIVGAVLSNVQGVRRMGSAALDLAWVATGRFDAFWEVGLHPWDVAAGILLVQEAGGTVTNLESTPSTPFDTAFYASNGVSHQEFCGLIAAAMK